jgi:hypothetical protein
MMETKRCTRCDIEQPLDGAHFGKRETKTGQGWRWDSWCRGCYAANTKRIQTIDPERKRQKDKEWRERNSERYAKNRQLRYQQRSTPEKERMRVSHRKYNQSLKQRCLDAYRSGPIIACDCCLESNSALLTLDHSNDDGQAHRKELGGNKNGAAFYKLLENNGFPQDLGLRILCQSCNWARHWTPDRRCPHEIECPNIIELAGTAHPNHVAQLDREISVAA